MRTGTAREKFKTQHTVFDDHTNRNLFKLISEGQFDGMIGPLSVGKESNVFYCKKGAGKVIAKIYRLETSDFNRMYDYIKTDPRYLHLKKRRRGIIFAWAQREYRNLILAREGQVRVPTAYTVKDNILVMEMIGDKEAAPKVKDSVPDDPERFAADTIEQMRRLNKVGLSHGDLSSFNILNLNEKPVLIDFSQASPLDGPLGKELLLRDIKNVCAFFRKIGVKMDEGEAHQRITAVSPKSF